MDLDLAKCVSKWPRLPIILSLNAVQVHCLLKELCPNLLTQFPRKQAQNWAINSGTGLFEHIESVACVLISWLVRKDGRPWLVG